MERMATSASMAIRINESLGLRNKLTRAMFCSLVAGNKTCCFFFARKAADERWDRAGMEAVVHREFLILIPEPSLLAGPHTNTKRGMFYVTVLKSYISYFGKFSQYMNSNYCQF